MKALKLKRVKNELQNIEMVLKGFRFKKFKFMLDLLLQYMY